MEHPHNTLSSWEAVNDEREQSLVDTEEKLHTWVYNGYDSMYKACAHSNQTTS